ncbi:MAG: shikimate dehydrogenase [Formivibrio sp.]|nr:shikimate dehydrogenase [Formivibrio sp.]
MRLAIFGNPIAQSKSPIIQCAFAEQFGLPDFEYGRILAPVDGFAESLHRFVAEGGQGGNVTAPFKEDAFRCCDRLTARAAAAQAVNTLKVEADGTILGDNTDGIGLVMDLRRFCSLAGKRILVLGAGGATRGVILPLAGDKPADIVIANRTAAKAVDLASTFSTKIDVPICGVALDQVCGVFDVIIDATSASLGGEAIPLPVGIFGTGCVAYEMVYGKGQTPFMRRAAEAGAAHLVEGLGMLVYQAVEAFELWTGLRPDAEPVFAMLRNA